MAKALTPMKIQYNRIKAQYPNCMLFFRLGDFYEMFDDDAVLASKELDLALTTRDRTVEDPEDRTPMCGVPYHSAEAYIQRLLKSGYNVAICEQVEDPKAAKGIVKRDVIRIITPGTVTESSMLEEGRSNYLGAVYLDAASGAVCFVDVSTGECCAAAYGADAAEHIPNELARFAPAELVLNTGAAENESLGAFIRGKLDAAVSTDADFDYMHGAARVCEQFSVESPDALGLSDKPAAVCAVGALLDYLAATQKCDLTHINSLDLFSAGRYMELDLTTRRNLELTENLRTGEKKGSLLWVLDRCRCSMGSRMLRSWVERPLLSVLAINRRLAAVSELHADSVLRGELRHLLHGCSDVQRLMSRVVYGSANGRDLVNLRLSLEILPEVQRLLENARSAELKAIAGVDDMKEICELIAWAICDEPPFSVREGGILRAGYSEEVDRLRSLRDNGAEMLRQLEAREKERTGIKKLKIGYNKVFGYYFDVPRAAVDQVPEDFIRKQTLVSNERFFTNELKDLENELLTAREHISELEYSYFCAVRDKVAAEVEPIQRAADALARLDALCAFAETAAACNYTEPQVDAGSVIRITGGRHPVVEAAQPDVLFVPNDVLLDAGDNRLAIITGPNMAGKSTYMRQTALIVLLAQMGSFVPAASAQIGLVDRVFTRIGASDDLASGQSTFMVEMTETASILRSATVKSLLILDEIGRGTSTYDGMAIARAVLEYCADKRRLGAKTMFATHYHELTELESLLPGVKNYHITARKQGGDLIFLRKIVPGAADDSYGIEVAKLAGVAESIITKAKAYLKELEAQGGGAAPRARAEAAEPQEESGQMSLEQLGGSEVLAQLRSLDLNTISPIEALNLLYALKRKAEG